MAETERDSKTSVRKRFGGNMTNIMKKARMKGEEFVTSKGRLVEQKKTGPDCNCSHKCTLMFTKEEKDHLIRTLYNGRPKNEKDIFLMGLIERHDVKRHRPTTKQSIQFPSSFTYFAIKKAKRIKVCRKAFLSLHAISSKAAFRLTSLLAAQTLPIDMRGKHNSHHKIPEETLVKLNLHIESFPKKTFYYSEIPVVYLEAGLTCKKMYELLIEKHPELQTTIKYEYFLRYYKENYGYPFGRPQIDVCSIFEHLNTEIQTLVQ